MSKQIEIAFLLFLCLATGCATLQAPEISEKATPVITQSFASQQISTGDTWKIYLKASCPNGEMRRIYAEINQPGAMPYPLTIIGIKKENAKELSGIITLSTANADSPMGGVHLTLTIHVQDRSGNLSHPVVFPLSIDPRSTQEAPPQGVFKEQELGAVMVTLNNGRFSL
jgi:hypothetical protein